MISICSFSNKRDVEERYARFVSNLREKSPLMPIRRGEPGHVGKPLRSLRDRIIIVRPIDAFTVAAGRRLIKR
jgi:hypothetical protein